MSDNISGARVQRVQKSTRQRRRDTQLKSKRRMAIDCTKPILLPQPILWCNDDGEARQWLLQEDLPWWFFGSFLNFCVRVYNGKPRRRKVSRTYTVAQRRLLACLRTHPMRDDELVEEMKHYLAGPAQKGVYEKGLANLRELRSHDMPELAMHRAQEELYSMIFCAEQRENHKLTMDLDYGSTPAPGLEARKLPSPPVYPPFTLPLRLGVPTCLKGVEEPIEQQYDSGRLLAQAREDDMRMRLD